MTIFLSALFHKYYSGKCETMSSKILDERKLQKLHRGNLSTTGRLACTTENCFVLKFNFIFLTSWKMQWQGQREALGGGKSMLVGFMCHCRHVESHAWINKSLLMRIQFGAWNPHIMCEHEKTVTTSIWTFIVSRWCIISHSLTVFREADEFIIHYGSIGASPRESWGAQRGEGNNFYTRERMRIKTVSDINI